LSIVNQIVANTASQHMLGRRRYFTSVGRSDNAIMESYHYALTK